MAITSRVLAAAVALVALLAPSVPAVAAADVVVAAPVRVMPLGDSITYGDKSPGGYRVGLWQKFAAGGYSVDFVGSRTDGPSSLIDRNHEGHPGWTISQINSNITTWLRTYNPQTILLHIGTNDMWRDPRGAPSRLSALVDRITTLAPNTRVFVAMITPISGMDSTVRAFNATVPPMVKSKASAGKKVYLVDQYHALTTADLADGVHPNARGYYKMATTWYNALLSVPGSIVNASPSQAAACSKGYVGLTFDDGPTSNTPALLNALKQNGLRATMFNEGRFAAANPAGVRAEVSAGMWIGNHSYTHPHMNQISKAEIDSEISRTQQAIANAGGGTPKLFRPPFGTSNSTVRSVAAKYGLREIIWDITTGDWSGVSVDRIVQANAKLTNGQIILMHDGPPNTVIAIPRIAQVLAGRGLCAGMISPQTGRAVAPN